MQSITLLNPAGKSSTLSFLELNSSRYILMDGSTDASNTDNELILVRWCDTDSTDEKVHSRLSFLTVYRPDSVTAEGLLDLLQYWAHMVRHSYFE